MVEKTDSISLLLDGERWYGDLLFEAGDILGTVVINSICSLMPYSIGDRLSPLNGNSAH